MDSYFIGKIDLITIVTPIGQRIVDKKIYLRAHIDPTIKLLYTIVPQLDGVVYSEYAVNTCLQLVHCAADNNIDFPPLPNIHTWLPKFLSVANWASLRLKPSEPFCKYVNNIRSLISRSVVEFRAILCDNDNFIGGITNRAEILNGKINLTPPMFLLDVDDSILYDNIAKYTYAQFAELAARKYPNHGKILNFGPECTQVVNSMFSLDEISIHYTGKKVTVCDIFMHGLKYILQ
jgi:hypothetical protein